MNLNGMRQSGEIMINPTQASTTTTSHTNYMNCGSQLDFNNIHSNSNPTSSLNKEANVLKTQRFNMHNVQEDKLNPY